MPSCSGPPLYSIQQLHPSPCIPFPITVRPSSPAAPFHFMPTDQLSSQYQRVDRQTMVIDTFTPARSYTVSDASTCRSSVPAVGFARTSARSAYENFLATHSRVVRMFNMPHAASSFLSAVFFPPVESERALARPMPVTLWALREDYVGPRPDEEDSVWAVFKAHEEAAAALSLSGPIFSVAPAVETDLQPFQKLRRFELPGPVSHMPTLLASRLHVQVPPSPATSLPPPSPARLFHVHPLRTSLSTSDMHGRVTRDPRQWAERSVMESEYTLSSNPPNARADFRMGDWICPAVHCASHNFGRNLICRGCGCARPADGFSSPEQRSPCSSTSWNQRNRICPSPRFSATSYSQPSLPQQPISPIQSTSSLLLPLDVHAFSKPQSLPPSPLQKESGSSYPVLTPSGRALAVGGKVQNVSNDHLAPCVLWWPDNESLPEQGQIRPSGISSMQHPPILNTGNHGPIEHQPGDWVCQKCSYLNWRRRKVCQTCFPYAEGNGDSISTAVQAERIALLASVISKDVEPSQWMQSPRLDPSDSSAHHSPSVHPSNSSSSLFIDLSPELHGLHSPYELPGDDASIYINSRPIYQTSGYHQSTPPSPSSPCLTNFKKTIAPGPLLPSFLHDIVRSPSLSPASSSSAVSLEEYDESFSLNVPRGNDQLYGRDGAVITSGSFSPLSGGNIWRLDGEESKALSLHPERPSAYKPHRDML